LLSSDRQRQTFGGSWPTTTCDHFFPDRRDTRLLFPNGERDRAQDIDRLYLSERDIRSQELMPHLRLNQADHNFYSKRVLALPDHPDRSVQPSRPSHRRIAGAAELPRNMSEALCRAEGEL
jgi:hypothetical protein